MTQAIVVVDAFTSIPFQGNPAAVCVLAKPADEAWMTLVAREMNLSETAFLYRDLRSSDGSTFHLRWLTPVTEVDLCGHATLAAAHVLWQDGHVAARQQIRFLTRSGPLRAQRVSESIELDFPVVACEPIEPVAGLAEALGVSVIGQFRAGDDLLVEVDDPIGLRHMRPDLGALEPLAKRGVIVTSSSDESSFDFLSRFFAPSAGVPEDPVTGSAHCALGPFWAERLGKDRLTGYQASRRGGVVGVRVLGGVGRVLLMGQAVTTLRAELLYPTA